MQYSKDIVKYLLFFCFCITSNSFVFGHSPTHSSTLVVEGKNGMWTLQIRASLTAFEQEVHTRYSKDSYTTPEEFKDLVKDIITRHLRISINNVPIPLQHPQVQLGHETVVACQFKSPETIAALTVKNSVFKNVYNSKNTLFIIKNKAEKNKFILSKANNFETKIHVRGSELVQIPQTHTTTNKSMFWLLSLLATITVLALGVLIYKKAVKKTYIP